MGFAMTLTEWVELIRNAALAFAAPLGVWVAWKGLNAWKEENRWQVDHELATKIYRAFAQRRTLYHYIRLPHSNPPLLSDKEMESKILEERKNENRTLVLLLYWQAIKDIDISQAELFDEANLRWNQDYRRLSENIRDLEHELACALDDQRAAEGGAFDPDLSARTHIASVISSLRDGDHRKEKYDNCFQKIEANLKPQIVDPSLRGRTK